MKKYILIITITIVIVIIILLAWMTYFRKAPAEVTVNVTEGQSTREIGANLKAKNAISSSLLFSFYVYKNHDLLQSGIYKITAGETLPQIVTKMKEGKVEEYLVTIPEGWRLTQIDALLSSRGIIKAGELLNIASAQEGYLFPDTYHFNLDESAMQIRDQMIENYKQQTSALNVTREDLIIASIVEREAKFDSDRAKIAGVYFSRLDQNMKLESNPTVEYAKGKWGPITSADIQNINSPYNTYMYAGLTPGPICSPGLKSILATLNPVKDGNLYFFTDSSGHAIYSKTFEEHQAKLKASN